VVLIMKLAFASNAFLPEFLTVSLFLIHHGFSCLPFASCPRIICPNIIQKWEGGGGDGGMMGACCGGFGSGDGDRGNLWGLRDRDGGRDGGRVRIFDGLTRNPRCISQVQQASRPAGQPGQKLPTTSLPYGPVSEIDSVSRR
jgi:hypothetical protein